MKKCNFQKLEPTSSNRFGQSYLQWARFTSNPCTYAEFLNFFLLIGIAYIGFDNANSLFSFAYRQNSIAKIV